MVYKSYYKMLSDNGELQNVSKTGYGLKGNIQAISETEYTLTLCAISCQNGITPPSSVFSSRDDVLKGRVT